MEEWKEYKLGDVVRLINGRAYLQHELFDKGKYKIVRVGNLSGGDKWFYSDMELSEEKYCEDGDLLYAWACNFGPYIWKGCKTIYHYHIWKLIEDDGVVDKLFLFYYLKYLTPYWLGNVNGSVMVHITKGTMEKFLISLPSLAAQRRIATILKSLDDKIELNRRINDNLEQQAQALFKSWFVDFEPFRDQPFVKSELGMIPQGWRVIQLIDIAEISKNSINPQKQPQTLFNHYSIPAFDEGMKPEIQLGEEIKSNKFVITNKITLFSKLNPRIKRVWYVDNLNSNSICSTEFVPYKAKDESQSSFLYSLINSQGFYDYVMSMVNGATGSHQRFHPEESLNYSIAFNYECVSKYCEVMSPIIHQMLENREESRRLAQLRDTLLPRLMSGEIKVGDVTL